MEARAITTTIRSCPAVSDYVPLAEHQSQTPETFFGGKPVLHYHAAGAKAFVPKSQISRLPFMPAAVAPADANAASEEIEGSEEEELVDQEVDIFVGSDTFTVFNRASSTGLSIPYPLIAIHAIKSLSDSATSKVQSVYMQLDLADGGATDDDFDTVELTIVPPSTSSSSPTTSDAPPANGEAPPPASSETAKLFEAVSACADLHPDPPQDGGEDEDDDMDRIVFESSVDDAEAIEGLPGVFRSAGGGGDDGLPPPFPGSGGWITAENMHEYFDEEGNWIGDEGVSGELGEGAGRVRGRDEAEGENGQGGATNGHGTGDDSESKRPRTE